MNSPLVYELRLRLPHRHEPFLALTEAPDHKEPDAAKAQRRNDQQRRSRKKAFSITPANVTVRSLISLPSSGSSTRTVENNFFSLDPSCGFGFPAISDE